MLALFEDVHWIDPSTRELLDLVVGRATGLPLLLVVTHRPEFRPPWSGQPHATTLALSRLARREGAALVRSVAGADLPDALVEEIVERTDGVPLFAEELTKAVLEAGGSAARTLGTASPAALAVPATLHASLLARLDRLPAAARTVAQVGAVIGREFSDELLAAVAGLDEADLATALDQLAAAGLVFRAGAGATTGYLFKHALVRDAAYGTLLRERRRQLHAAVARALEERWPELAEATPELVALHLAEAGEAGRAVGYWLKAGRRSAERSADREAVHQLRRGLDALATLPPSAERDRVELDFQLALGPRLVSTSSYANPDVAAAYERASALCESLQDAGRLIPVLWGLFAYYVGCGECRAALDLAERLRAAAEQGTDPGRAAARPPYPRVGLHAARPAAGGPVGARGGRGASRPAPRPRPGRPVHHRSARLGPGLPGARALDAGLRGPGRAPRPWRRSGTPTSWDTRARPFTYGSTRAPTSPRCSATVTRSRPMRGQQSRWRASTSSGHGGDSAPSCRAGRSSVTVATRKGWPSRAKAWRPATRSV